MNEYEQVINRAELALNNGEYKYCINLLNPKIEKYSVLTNEGVQIRLMLITALSGSNQNEDAVRICKHLIKSKNNLVRQEAKSLIQVLSSPNLKTPDSWNIKFENNSFKEELKPYKNKNKITGAPQKYINTANLPTGETKTFKNGFIIFTLILLISLISLLSGCVKVENTLDLRELDSINFNLKIKNKYINKSPWQKNFESELKELSSKQIVSIDNEDFLFKQRGLDLKKIDFIINKIIKIASKSSAIDLEDIEINHYEKNYLFVKKYFFKIKVDFTNLESINDLEIYLNIINPSKVKIIQGSNNVNLNNNAISWLLVQGTINQIQFSFWYWNKLFLGILIVTILIIFAYYIRKKRYELGSDLPQLPS